MTNIVCEKVGVDYFDTAPIRYTASEEIAATPAEIFAVLLDAESWTKWVYAIKEVEWTSPFPLEPGSTRTVHMLGSLIGYEEFIAYEHEKRMAFRFNEVSKGNIDAFAEDYQVTDLGNGRSRIDWVMAMGRPGQEDSGFVAGLRSKLMGGFIRMTLRRFRKYVESGPELDAG